MEDETINSTTGTSDTPTTQPADLRREWQTKLSKSWKQASESLQHVWEGTSREVATQAHNLQRGLQTTADQIGEAAGPPLSQAQASVQQWVVEPVQTHVQPHVERASVHLQAWGSTTQQSLRQLGQASAQTSRDVTAATQEHVARTYGAIQTGWEATSHKTRELGAVTQRQAGAAMVAATAAVAGVGKPPVSVENGKLVVKGEESDSWIEQFAGFHLIIIVGAVGLISGTLSFVLVSGQIVNLASLLLMMASPLVIYQRVKLEKLGSFRSQQNRLRHDTNRLAGEIQGYTATRESLQSQVKELDSVRDALSEQVGTSESNTQQLVDLVEQHKDLQHKIEQAVFNQVTRQILTTMLQCDTDKSFKMSHSEVVMLQYRLSKIPGITLDTKGFEEFIANDQGELTLVDVCSLVRDLQVADSRARQIFKLDEQFTKASTN